MAFFPPNTGSPKKERKLIPAGTHEAYCYGVVDLGTQERKPHLGKPKSPARALMLFFEFPEIKHQFKEDGPEEPMIKSERFSYFTDEKSNLHKFIMPWLSKPVSEVDFSELPGESASITITHNKDKNDPSKVYDNITSIGPVSPKLVKLMPARINKTMLFSIMEHGFESEEFNSLYPWVQEIIKRSEEYETWTDRVNIESAPTQEDEIPF